MNHIKRLQKEMLIHSRNPYPGIYIDYDENNITQMKGLIFGPKDTPYYGGFFLFDIDVKNTYPSDPPHVTYLSTNYGKTRFNPNLYKEGKVCLSLLGTWSGPSWTPAYNIATVLLSIQGLIFVENPIQNEPGYEKNIDTMYDTYVIYHTIEHCFIEFYERRYPIPDLFYDIFLNTINEELIDELIAICSKKVGINKITVSYSGINETINFNKLINKLNEIKRIMNGGKKE